MHYPGQSNIKYIDILFSLSTRASQNKFRYIIDFLIYSSLNNDVCDFED